MQHRKLAAYYAVVHRFNTFQLTNDARDTPEAMLQMALDQLDTAQGRFRALQNGETWVVG